MNQQNSIEERSLVAAEYAYRFEIKTNEQNQQAAELLKSVQLLKKEVNATFDPIISKAHKTHKEAKAQKDKFAIPLASAEKAYKEKLAGYAYAQEQIRVKEETRLRLLAEEKERKLLARAKEAEEAGNAEKAAKLANKASEVVAPVIPQTYEKPSNISFTTRYYCEIEDRKAIPREMNGIELLIPDMQALNRLATISRGAFKIPGIKIISKRLVAGRTEG